MPTRFNDGRPVEQELYFATNGELARQFGAVSFLPETLRGTWLHQGRTFEEENVRLFVDVEDTPENAQCFARYKQKLKERFRQIDIWIVSYDIRIT